MKVWLTSRDDSLNLFVLLDGRSIAEKEVYFLREQLCKPVQGFKDQILCIPRTQVRLQVLYHNPRK